MCSMTHNRLVASGERASGERASGEEGWLLAQLYSQLCTGTPTGTAGSHIGPYHFQGPSCTLSDPCSPQGKVHCHGIPMPSRDLHEVAWTAKCRQCYTVATSSQSTWTKRDSTTRNKEFGNTNVCGNKKYCNKCGKKHLLQSLNQTSSTPVRF